jgi:ATP-dependent DNA helicase RecG
MAVDDVAGTRSDQADISEHTCAEIGADAFGFKLYFFAALCNEANLKGELAGWLVFGVQDKPRKVVGTQYRPHRADLDNLKQEIAQHTTGRITFKEIHELRLPEGRVILFEIPPAPQGIPVAWKGHFYGRDAHALGALNLQEIEQIRSQTAHQDWSAQTCQAATITDLDRMMLREILGERE